MDGDHDSELCFKLVLWGKRRRIHRWRRCLEGPSEIGQQCDSSSSKLSSLFLWEQTGRKLGVVEEVGGGVGNQVENRVYAAIQLANPIGKRVSSTTSIIEGRRTKYSIGT